MSLIDQARAKWALPWEACPNPEVVKAEWGENPRYEVRLWHRAFRHFRTGEWVAHHEINMTVYDHANDFADLHWSDGHATVEAAIDACYADWQVQVNAMPAPGGEHG